MKALPRIAALCLIAILAIVVCSCETESAGGSSLSVSPADSTLSKGQSVTLTAHGGEVYNWSLSDTGLGHLSGTMGASVVYTADAAFTVSGTTTNKLQSITVSASASTSGTNTTSGASVTATVHHQ